MDRSHFWEVYINLDFRTEFDASKECPEIFELFGQLEALEDNEEERRKVGTAFFDSIGIVVVAYNEATESATLFTASTELASEESFDDDDDDDDIERNYYRFRGLPIRPHAPKPESSVQDENNFVQFEFDRVFETVDSH